MTDLVVRARGPAPRSRLPDRPYWREHLALAALVLLFVGVAGLFASSRPPFAGTDESAHLGYAHVVASLDLPWIETSPPVPDTARTWQVERASAESDDYREVWVANHPPLHYAVVAPLVWFADLTGRADGGLLYLRFANVLAGAVGLVFTYLLALEAVGVRRIAVAAAGIAGLIGVVPAALSLGLNDGTGFAAATFLLWAAARCWKAGAATLSRRDVLVLGAATTVAAGARAATLLMALAVVVVVTVGLALDRSATAARRRRRAATVLLVGFGAPLLCFGWFYARVWMRYGDLGASSFLLDRFDREARGSVLAMFTQGNLWLRVFRRLTSPSTFRIMPMPGSALLGAMGLGGFLVALRTQRSADRGADGRRGRIDRRVVFLFVVAAAIVALTVAQHLAGGGMTHARYLFPALAPLAIVMAIGFDQLRPRVAPALLLAVLTAWALVSVPAAADRDAEARERAVRVPGRHLLTELPGSTTSRLVLAGLVVIGAAVAGAALLDGIRHPRPRSAPIALTPTPTPVDTG